MNKITFLFLFIILFFLNFILPAEAYTSFTDFASKQPTYGGFVNPNSIHYGDKTYLVWQGDENYEIGIVNPYIIIYYENNNTFSQSYKIGTSLLKNDTHGSPVLWIDQNEYIHVVYGSDNSTTKHSKSQNTLNITSWIEQTNLPNSTYNHIIQPSSEIVYNFYRCGFGINKYCYIKSVDGGDTWGTETVFLNMSVGKVQLTASYNSNFEYDSINNRVWTSYTTFNGSQNTPFYCCYVNMSAFYINLSDNNVYLVDGTNLGTQITGNEEWQAVIYNSGNSQTGIPTINLDNSQDPNIIFTNQYPPLNNNSYSTFHMVWNGSTWTTKHIPTDGNTGGSYEFQGALSDFYFDSNNDITAYIIELSSSIVKGNVVKWSYNSSLDTWTRIKDITSGGIFNYPTLVQNHNNASLLRINEYGTTWNDIYHGYLINSDDEFLPFVESVPATPTPVVDPIVQLTNNVRVNLDNGAYIRLISPLTFQNLTDPVIRTYNSSGNPKETFELNFNDTRVRWHTATNKDLSKISYDSTNDILRFNISGVSGYVNTTFWSKNATESYNFKVNDTVVFTNTSDSNGIVSFNFTGGDYSVTVYAGGAAVSTTNISGFVNNTLGAYVDGVRVDLGSYHTFTKVTVVVNNTNLAPTFHLDHIGTSERVSTAQYRTGDTPIQVMVMAHASSVSETADINFSINNMSIARSSGRPLGGAEESWKSVDIIVPINSNYSVNISNYHHYEWREYPLINGYYEFLNIPTGTYTLLFQQVAYKNNSQSVTLISSNYTINATIIPQFTPEEAEFVIDTADLTYLALLLAIMDLSLFLKYKRKNQGRNTKAMSR